MKLGTILTATDLNPLYTEFIPAFIDTWSALVPEADICIVLIADAIPENLQPYARHLTLMPPVPGVATAFQAQCIRLLHPRDITRNEGVLITDMDMLPLNRAYYVNSIATAPEDAFVIYRMGVLHQQYPMCYNIAHPATWRSVFGHIPSAELIASWWNPTFTGGAGGPGWYTDQIRLYDAVNAWSGPKVGLRDMQTRFKRLDRSQSFTRHLDHTCMQVKIGMYSDYHALRPYNQHKATNDAIVAAVRAQSLT